MKLLLHYLSHLLLRHRAMMLVTLVTSALWCLASLSILVVDSPRLYEDLPNMLRIVIAVSITTMAFRCGAEASPFSETHYTRTRPHHPGVWLVAKVIFLTGVALSFFLIHSLVASILGIAEDRPTLILLIALWTAASLCAGHLGLYRPRVTLLVGLVSFAVAAAVLWPNPKDLHSVRTLGFLTILATLCGGFLCAAGLDPRSRPQSHLQFCLMALTALVQLTWLIPRSLTAQPPLATLGSAEVAQLQNGRKHITLLLSPSYEQALAIRADLSLHSDLDSSCVRTKIHSCVIRNEKGQTLNYPSETSDAKSATSDLYDLSGPSSRTFSLRSIARCFRHLLPPDDYAALKGSADSEFDLGQHQKTLNVSLPRGFLNPGGMITVTATPHINHQIVRPLGQLSCQDGGILRTPAFILKLRPKSFPAVGRNISFYHSAYPSSRVLYITTGPQPKHMQIGCAEEIGQPIFPGLIRAFQPSYAYSGASEDAIDSGEADPRQLLLFQISTPQESLLPALTANISSDRWDSFSLENFISSSYPLYHSSRFLADRSKLLENPSQVSVHDLRLLETPEFADYIESAVCRSSLQRLAETNATILLDYLHQLAPNRSSDSLRASIIQALTCAPDTIKPHVLATFPTCPALADLVVRRGWAHQARATIHQLGKKYALALTSPLEAALLYLKDEPSETILMRAFDANPSFAIYSSLRDSPLHGPSIRALAQNKEASFGKQLENANNFRLLGPEATLHLRNGSQPVLKACAQRLLAVRPRDAQDTAPLDKAMQQALCYEDFSPIQTTPPEWQESILRSIAESRAPLPTYDAVRQRFVIHRSHSTSTPAPLSPTK